MNPAISENIPCAGETPLVEAKNLEHKLGIQSIYLKLEKNNPTHTHKDRAASTIVRIAKEKGYDSVAVGTCGNFGVSVAYFCLLYGLKSYLFIPRNYDLPRLAEMQRYKATIEFVEGTYEDAVFKSAEFAKQNGYFDANPHGEGGKVAIEGYKKISAEILKELGDTPTIIWIPVGNGTLLTGVYRGFSEARAQFSLGAVSSKGNNEIIESYSHKKRVNLTGADLNETPINEPLLNWLPTQLNESLDALKVTNGFAYGATDKELIEAQRIIKSSEKVETSPSSAAGFAGLLKFRKVLPRAAAQVIILTS